MVGAIIDYPSPNVLAESMPESMMVLDSFVELWPDHSPIIVCAEVGQMSKVDDPGLQDICSLESLDRN